ncbi:IS66 family transposase [Pseudomonas aeruginosa]|uniref:IS66 family transposase n=1 Tax=Pseudomonas aeruginosa group TaxID=136841 RepID=UPI0004EF9A94|nr:MULTISPECIES: IS66 family transposase [Pseudomonas aeruginosa group]MBG5397646.1 IS66 family transposase [Pseudomonas aeruginosa]MBH4351306.1 IS66 family transposase [Pseudomonas aeruginosa]MBX6109635.1 IS66 family transposase [Pseudomonas aeruginosa]MCS8145114.1 IS66 family transposase [Pseudomonas aeruginosa]MDS9599928.1 IS66 family transposase [Pseudomonas aeruginosa]
MDSAAFDHLTPEQLRQLAAQLSQRVDHLETLNQRLNHELAVLRRHRFARRSEQLNADQLNLLEEMIDADIAAIEAELEAARPAPAKRELRQQPRRAPLPAELPRTLILHEPDSTQCACGCQLKRIGEDVSEKLDYTPGSFTVERHIRGKWVCAKCEILIQAPVPAQVIDKGIPTAGLLAQVMVAKFADHLPLYRQEKIFARAGLAIARSTLAQWVGACGVQLQPLVDALRDCLLRQDVILADETPVQMLAPGTKKTQRAYVWAYAPSPFADLKAVVYDFRPSRAGEHVRSFLGDWQGKLVCDDFAGYKASFEQGVTEIGCMAHARRKFFDLHAANQSQLAEQALQYIGQLYEVEREGRELLAEHRRQLRQDKARPIIDGLHGWMLGQRQKVPEGSAIAKALDYSLKRWAALVRYLDDGNLPIDNNWIENQIRPWALGRSNWLFAGSLRSGQRGAALMTLIQSARLNGHDPYAYLKDMLVRLPTQKASALIELLPHNWVPAGKV